MRPLTCDGRVTAGALLGVEAAEAFDTVRTFSLWGEGLTGQRRLTAWAEETLFVPHFVLVGDAALGQSLKKKKKKKIVHQLSLIKN